MCNSKLRALVIFLTISLFASAITRNASGVSTPKAQPQGALNARVIRQVRHELVTLPYYGVFDWLQFEVRPDNTHCAAWASNKAQH